MGCLDTKTTEIIVLFRRFLSSVENKNNNIKTNLLPLDPTLKLFIMKNLILFIVILLCSIMIKAQTVDEVAKQILGTEIGTISKRMIKTDYGSLVFKLAGSKGIVEKITIKLTNGQANYDRIIEESHNYQIKIGSTWTDLYYTFIPLKSRKFKRLKDAKDYFNSIDKNEFEVYQQLHIYKIKGKEKYIVGIFNMKYPDHGKMVKSDIQGNKIQDVFEIIE